MSIFIQTEELSKERSNSEPSYACDVESIFS